MGSNTNIYNSLSWVPHFQTNTISKQLTFYLKSIIIAVSIIVKLAKLQLKYPAVKTEEAII